MSQSTEDFYKRLKEELEKTTEKWPAEYLYKFIVPAKEENVAFIESTFNNMGAIIKTKKSKKGNYISISVNVIMKSADTIIQKYQEVSSVEGLISL